MPAPDASATPSLPPLRAALIAQIAGALIAFALLWLLRPWLTLTLPGLALLQGLCATCVSWRLGAPRWWWLIHLVFMPLVVLALALQIPPGWYLAAFVLTLLVFWRTDRSQVPLYLSNATTAAAVVQLLPAHACSVLDIGCGDGRLLRHLATARPDCCFTGIEHAPLPWLLAKALNLGRPNVNIRYGDFWQHPLNNYDVVYAFLSPAPMSALWNKVCAEMPTNKLLISNSFPVPGQETEQVLQLPDRRQTQIFCYKPALKNTAKPQN